jgi:hypothetical protein
MKQHDPAQQSVTRTRSCSANSYLEELPYCSETSAGYNKAAEEVPWIEQFHISLHSALHVFPCITLESSHFVITKANNDKHVITSGSHQRLALTDTDQKKVAGSGTIRDEWQAIASSSLPHITFRSVVPVYSHK